MPCLGVWIPTTSNEGMWYGIAQWFGVESNEDLEYVLPNLNNFGCRLYSESTLYSGGIGVYTLILVLLFAAPTT